MQRAARGSRRGPRGAPAGQLAAASGGHRARAVRADAPYCRPRGERRVRDARGNGGGAGVTRQIAVADVGGTHARFALASVEADRVLSLDEPVTLKTAEHASFQTAWEEFGRRKQIDLPKELAIAFAGPIGGEVLKLTNNPWVIRPALIHERLGVERYTIVNDFGAVGHAVATVGDEDFRHICGPDQP